MSTRTNPFPVSAARRGCDVLVSGTLLLLAAPFLAVVALLILLTDGRPVLFWQWRVGEGGEPFRICKLRTMRVGSDGPGVTAVADPRITGVGRLLRRTSLDEVPQLWQILTGRMTLVGPRPESVALAERYPLSLRQVLLARPGLTGPTQLRFRTDADEPPDGLDLETWYFEVLVPLRVHSDMEFLARPTLVATLRWIVMTGLFVLGLVNPRAPTTASRDGDLAA
jgi:lipopolysaccharide/colanic/teichoic acid biosynthesis glycosyltransferase